MKHWYPGQENQNAGRSAAFKSSHFLSLSFSFFTCPVGTTFGVQTCGEAGWTVCSEHSGESLTLKTLFPLYGRSFLLIHTLPPHPCPASLCHRSRLVSEAIYTVVFISSYLSPLPTRAGTLSVFTEVSLVHPHQCLHTESTQ